MKRLLVTMVAAGFALSTSAADNVKIGVVLPFTGPVASDGARTFNGAQLAVNEVNARGGVSVGGARAKLDVVKEDSTCTPRLSVAATEKLMTRDRVAAVIGDFCSTSTLADSEVAKRSKVALITPISIAPPITKGGNEYMFRTCDNSDMMARAFAEFAVQKLGIKKWAFLARNDDYGRGAVESLTPLIKKAGGSVVAVEYHPQGATDYYTLLTKIRATKPDGLALVANSAEHSIATNQAAELGMTKEMRMLDPTSAYFNADFLRITGKNAEGLVGPTRYVDVIDTPENKKFVAAYEAAYKEKPDKFAQSGYETVLILAAAIERASGTDPKAVRDALAKTDYRGLQGRAYRFDPTNQIVIDEYVIQVKGNGYDVLGKVPAESIMKP